MRFVHVADVHLDTSFSGRSEAVRQRLRDASREAFGRAVDLAIREDAHAFLIAGDLFDGTRLSFSTERFLLDQARRLGEHGITLVYATGNHDPGAAEVSRRALAWPERVHVASNGTPRRIAVRDREDRLVGHVTAVGHAKPEEREDLSRRLPRPSAELPEVALLHTQVHSSIASDAHHPYAPSQLAYLKRAGFDYWALGHVHFRQILSEDPPVAYPGSLQGRTHADSGPRGALLVDLSDRGAPTLSFFPLAPVRWETLEVDGLQDADSLDRLERRVDQVWRTARSGDAASGAEWMVRVLLEGPCPLWRELRRNDDREVLAVELREMLDALDVVVIADDVHSVVPIEEHRRRTDVLGETLRLVEAVRRGTVTVPGIEVGMLAGIASEDARGVDEYVRGLLRGADYEIAARMQVVEREGA